MTDKITYSDVKKLNKNRIFKFIFNSGKVARQDIADKLELSLPTVNQNLKLLKDEQLIRFVGSFDSTGGRRAQMIIVNSSNKMAINITIRNDGVVASLLDFNGDICDTRISRVPFNDSPGYAYNIHEQIDMLISDNKVDKKNVLGVGITVPGTLDKDAKTILSAPTMHLKNYPVENIVRYIEFPYVIMNDAKAAAYAESWKSQNDLNSSEQNETVFLNIDDGVGGSINSDFHQYQGMNNRAGELGHITIIPGGRICECGRRGCLESYISTRRLSSDVDVTLDEFFKGVEAGNEKYQSRFDEYLEYLAIGVNSIYSIFDSTVILGGTINKYLDKYIDILRNKLVEKSSFETDGTYLKLSSRHDNEALIGASLTFIGKYIENV